MVIERIRRYLDEEKFVARTHQEVFEVIAKHTSDKFAKELNIYLENSYPGIGFYRRVAEPVNGMAIYDYLVARNRALIEDRMALQLSLGRFSGKGKILDVCSGTGYDACFLAQYFPNSMVIGIDSCTEMVERARERAKRLKLDNAFFMPASNDDIPFRNDTFNLVISNNGITEGQFTTSVVADRADAIRRVLVPGGRVFVSIPSDLSEECSEEDRKYEGIFLSNPFKKINFRDVAYQYLSNYDLDKMFFGEVIVSATK